MVLVHRIYFVIVLCGASISAFAGEMDRIGFSSIFSSSWIYDVCPIPDSLTRYKYGKNRASIRIADNATPAKARPTSVAEHNKKFIARMAGQYKDLGGNIGKLLLHKSIELRWDNLRFKLQTDYASIEAGQFKVSLQHGSTSIMWSQGI